MKKLNLVFLIVGFSFFFINTAIAQGSRLSVIRCYEFEGIDSIPNNFTFYDWSSDSLLIGITREEWHPYYLTMQGYSRQTLEYNSDRLPTLVIDYLLEYGDWVYSTKREYLYDISGKSLRTIKFDWENSWKNNQLDTFVYNPEGRLHYKETHLWSQNEWMTLSRTEYSYDGQDIPSEEINLTYNPQNSTWIKSTKKESLNSPEGLPEIIINSNWNSGNQEWIEKKRETFGYNTEMLLENLLVEVNDMNVPATWENNLLENHLWQAGHKDSVQKRVWVPTDQKWDLFNILNYNYLDDKLQWSEYITLEDGTQLNKRENSYTYDEQARRFSISIKYFASPPFTDFHLSKCYYSYLNFTTSQDERGLTTLSIPNPVNSGKWVKLGEDFDFPRASIRLISPEGKVVYQSSISGQLYIPNHISPGLYIIEIYSNSQRQHHQKILVLPQN